MTFKIHKKNERGKAIYTSTDHNMDIKIERESNGDLHLSRFYANRRISETYNAQIDETPKGIPLQILCAMLMRIMEDSKNKTTNDSKIRLNAIPSSGGRLVKGVYYPMGFRIDEEALLGGDPNDLDEDDVTPLIMTVGELISYCKRPQKRKREDDQGVNKRRTVSQRRRSKSNLRKKRKSRNRRYKKRLTNNNMIYL